MRHLKFKKACKAALYDCERCACYAKTVLSFCVLISIVCHSLLKTSEPIKGCLAPFIPCFVFAVLVIAGQFRSEHELLHFCGVGEKSGVFIVLPFPLASWKLVEYLHDSVPG